MSFSVRSRCALMRNSLLVVLLVNSGSVRAQIQFQPYQVHIGYVIPSNRQAQPNAVSERDDQQRRARLDAFCRRENRGDAREAQIEGAEELGEARSEGLHNASV